MRSLAQAFFVHMLHWCLLNKNTEVQRADVTCPKMPMWESGSVKDELTLPFAH